MLDIAIIGLVAAIAVAFIRFCETGLSLWFGDATKFDP